MMNLNKPLFAVNGFQVTVLMVLVLVLVLWYWKRNKRK